MSELSAGVTKHRVGFDGATLMRHSRSPASTSSPTLTATCRNLRVVQIQSVRTHSIHAYLPTLHSLDLLTSN